MNLIYTTSVLEHISRCVDRVTTQKTTILFPKQKPLIKQKVCFLLNACISLQVWRHRDLQCYQSEERNLYLRREICKAKHEHKLQIEASDWSLQLCWPQEYVEPCTTRSASLPEEHGAHAPAWALLGEQLLTLSSITFREVCSTLSTVNAQKSDGPYGIPGWVFRACAEQQAGVFTDHVERNTRKTKEVIVNFRCESHFWAAAEDLTWSLYSGELLPLRAFTILPLKAPSS